MDRVAKWTSPEHHDLARCIDGGDDHHGRGARQGEGAPGAWRYDSCASLSAEAEERDDG
jgi:hypothetical protein